MELKMCECGGQARILNDFRDLVVVCPHCGKQDGYFKTRADAITAWNRRVTLPAMPETDDPAAHEAWRAECEAIQRRAMERAREASESPFGDNER